MYSHNIMNASLVKIHIYICTVRVTSIDGCFMIMPCQFAIYDPNYHVYMYNLRVRQYVNMFVLHVHLSLLCTCIINCLHFFHTCNM